MPVVVVPPPYRGPTQGQERIDVAGATVGECLSRVGERFPGFSEQIFDAQPLCDLIYCKILQFCAPRSYTLLYVANPVNKLPRLFVFL